MHTVMQGREEHRGGKELLLMLAEVRGRPADCKQSFIQVRANSLLNTSSQVFIVIVPERVET